MATKQIDVLAYSFIFEEPKRYGRDASARNPTGTGKGRASKGGSFITAAITSAEAQRLRSTALGVGVVRFTAFACWRWRVLLTGKIKREWKSQKRINPDILFKIEASPFLFNPCIMCRDAGFDAARLD